jgi:hypothetical protein
MRDAYHECASDAPVDAAKLVQPCRIAVQGGILGVET